MFNISYEQYLSNPSLLNEIQLLLGVPEKQLKSGVIKQNPESLEELIINYSEVEKALRGTKWENTLTLLEPGNINFTEGHLINLT